MKACIISRPIKTLLLLSITSQLAACAGSGLQNRSNSVSDAYNTSGLVAVSPYNRTIFSSSNF